MNDYLKTLIIVTMLVLLGEWAANLLAEYRTTFIGIGLALLSAVVIRGLVTSKKSRP